jgi:hypothetical protein
MDQQALQEQLSTGIDNSPPILGKGNNVMSYSEYNQEVYGQDNQILEEDA